MTNGDAIPVKSTFTGPNNWKYSTRVEDNGHQLVLLATDELATAGPQEVSQALLRASPAELKALGVRMLRGVLAHEFSHVMDRHMLSGAIAGALSSAVAFASTTRHCGSSTRTPPARA